jgi:hypothetical protein
LQDFGHKFMPNCLPGHKLVSVLLKERLLVYGLRTSRMRHMNSGFIDQNGSAHM